MAGLGKLLTLLGFVVCFSMQAAAADQKKAPARQRARKPIILAPPGEVAPLALDLQLLISQLDTAEREPARELLNGYRLSFDAIEPNRLLIQVETRGVANRTPREPMERAVREKIDRARQLARDQGGATLRVSVWINGIEAKHLSDPETTS